MVHKLGKIVNILGSANSRSCTIELDNGGKMYTDLKYLPPRDNDTIQILIYEDDIRYSITYLHELLHTHMQKLRDFPSGFNTFCEMLNLYNGNDYNIQYSWRERKIIYGGHVYSVLVNVKIDIPHHIRIFYERERVSDFLAQLPRCASSERKDRFIVEYPKGYKYSYSLGRLSYGHLNACEYYSREILIGKHIRMIVETYGVAPIFRIISQLEDLYKIKNDILMHTLIPVEDNPLQRLNRNRIFEQNVFRIIFSFMW
jgi:hypothetical protein